MVSNLGKLATNKAYVDRGLKELDTLHLWPLRNTKILYDACIELWDWPGLGGDFKSNVITVFRECQKILKSRDDTFVVAMPLADAVPIDNTLFEGPSPGLEYPADRALAEKLVKTSPKKEGT